MVVRPRARSPLCLQSLPFPCLWFCQTCNVSSPLLPLPPPLASMGRHAGCRPPVSKKACLCFEPRPVMFSATPTLSTSDPPCALLEPHSQNRAPVRVPRQTGSPQGRAPRHWGWGPHVYPAKRCVLRPARPGFESGLYHLLNVQSWAGNT